MAMSSRLIATTGAVMLLSACTEPLGQAGSLDAGWGEASKYNAAVQTIDPEPVYAATGAQPGDNGEKGANAVKRYRTDQVKETESLGVDSGSTGGGSGPR
jgi:hypothetical protein